jgi:DNA gyrase subunit B
MKAASKLKVKDKHDPLPGILYTATKAGPEARELFIVEGDSAAGCFLIDTPVMQADGSTLTFGEMVERHERGEKMFIPNRFK